MSRSNPAFTTLVAALSILMLGCVKVYSPPSPEPTGDAPPPASDTTAADTTEDDEDDPYEEWSEATKDATRRDGLFTVYEKREKILLALDPDQFGRFDRKLRDQGPSDPSAADLYGVGIERA